MEILAFLGTLSIAILSIAWGFGFFNSSAPKLKHQSRSRSPHQTPSKVLKPQERNTATVNKPTLPASPLQNKTISTSNHTIAPRQLPAFKKSRTRPTNKHQLNIQHGDRVLQQIRSKATEFELPMAIAFQQATAKSQQPLLLG